MPGPLPERERRRRNAPTIPTTKLPASGRKGPVPRVPKGYDLKDRGKAWWRWAWRLPQACGWDDGTLYVVARRAELEDDLELVGASNPGGIDFDRLLYAGDDPVEVPRIIRMTIQTLQALAGGKLAIEREMRELDNRLGLTPKGLADLRWTIIDDIEPAMSGTPSAGDEVSAKRRAREEQLAALS